MSALLEGADPRRWQVRARSWRLFLRWSAGRRSALRHWARAPRKRSVRVTGLGRGRAGGPIARAAQRGFANPWRLPALHSPFGETENGNRPTPGLQTTGAMTHA